MFPEFTVSLSNGAGREAVAHCVLAEWMKMVTAGSARTRTEASVCFPPAFPKHAEKFPSGKMWLYPQINLRNARLNKIFFFAVGLFILNRNFSVFVTWGPTSSITLLSGGQQPVIWLYIDCSLDINKTCSKHLNVRVLCWSILWFPRSRKHSLAAEIYLHELFRFHSF